MAHTMRVPDWIWEWGQRTFDKQVPASDLADILAKAVVTEIQGTPSVVQIGVKPASPEPENLEPEWERLGCGVDAIDTEFSQARKAWIAAFTSEHHALRYLLTRARNGINNPRAWLIDWYHKPVVG